MIYGSLPEPFNEIACVVPGKCRELSVNSAKLLNEPAEDGLKEIRGTQEGPDTLTGLSQRGEIFKR